MNVHRCCRRVLRLAGVMGLSLMACASPQRAQVASEVPGASADSELLALRRDNDALRQELELMRDQELMCSATSESPKAPREAIRLKPQREVEPARAQASRPRGVSLQDVPHSAPDEAVMRRYAASAASRDEVTSAEPKRYRLVGQGRVQGADPQTKRTSKSPRLSVTALYGKARKFYQRNQRAQARDLFDQLVREYPQSDLADNAVYWLAEDDREAGRLEQAKAGFMRVLSDYPAGNKVEDAMYMLGLCFVQEANFNRARAMLKKVAKVGRKELRMKARKELVNLNAQSEGSESMNGR